MASFRESVSIEKLNSSNYSTWKFKLEMLLIKEDLYDVITGTPPDPMTEDFRKRDNKARAIINLFIENSQIINVKSESSASGTWNALKNIHERGNLTSKLYLLRKLYSSKLAEGGNMIHHITRILELVDQLNAIGETIDNSHISALLLCSIPQSYDTLITALEARDEVELTPQFIQNKLIDEFKRRTENNAESCTENASKAFKANKKNTGFNNYKKPNKFCSYCKRSNHTISECYHLKNKSGHTHNNNRNYKQNKNTSSLCYEYDTQYEPKGALSKKKINHNTATADEEPSSSETLKHLAFLANKPAGHKWIIDSGSSSHIANDKTLFTEMKNDENSSVIIANGKSLKSYGTGDVEITTITSEGDRHNITLKEVLFVPDLESNLISVHKATQNGCELTFQHNKCDLKYNGKTYLEGKIKNNLYEVILDKEPTQNYANISYQCKNTNCIELWHKRMGHKNYAAIREIISKQLANGIKIDNCKHNLICETCIKCKLSETPYPKAAQNRASKVLQLIHTDVCGPFQTPTLGGKTYFVTFIDDFSRFTFIYLISKKSEVESKIKEFVSMVTNKFGKSPEAIRSDNGGEYTGHETEKFLKEKGIHHQLTVPHSPSQNGVAERRNRTLVEMTKSMLSEANLPKSFWGEAINTAVYIQNRTPSKSTQKTPFELWNKTKPDLSNLKVFGCKAYTYIDKTKRDKLDDRAEEGTFVGYDNRSKGYRIHISGRNIKISRTVKFIELTNTTLDEVNNPRNENRETNEPSVNHKTSHEVEINQEHENIKPQATTPPEPRRSQRTNKGVPPDRYIYITKPETVHEPNSWKEIEELTNPIQKQNWIQATREEINSLNENKTWTLVEPPQGQKVIGSKWTFKIKTDSQGNIQKYKARLVAKGFLQKYGIDYQETFAPVVSYTTIRSFLAAAASKKLNVHHIDVKTAFLHGDLDETVYMSQPEGYISPGEERKVCKLNKAIYGLKQAARSWYIKIGNTLDELEFKQSIADPCLYTKKINNDIIFIIVYVDDILVSGKEEHIHETVEQLSKQYDIKDLGNINYYLGINVSKTKEGNFALNQKNKIEELINKFGLTDSKPTDTPLEPGYMKINDEENLMPNNNKYRQAIGALLYISSISRPDISAAVNILSRRNESPREMDWNQVKRVMRYLKTTKDLQLIIEANPEPVLEAFVDADWGGDTQDRKSTSGNLFLLGKSPIQWASKKQTSVALSSAEAEYISAANASQEIQWLLKLLEDLELPQNLPIIMHEDNQSSIKMITYPKYSGKSKHIEIKFHCIKNLVETGIIELQYCPTEIMTADILTKPLPKPQFTRLRDNLQLLPIFR